MRGLTPVDELYTSPTSDAPPVIAGSYEVPAPPKKGSVAGRKPKSVAPPPDAAKTMEYPMLGELYSLSGDEATSLTDPLVRGFLKFWELSDQAIGWTNARHIEPRIWRTIDERQTAELVVSLIGAGRQNPLVAAAIRRLAETFNALQVGMILGPRFLQTFRFYLENGGFKIGL